MPPRAARLHLGLGHLLKTLGWPRLAAAAYRDAIAARPLWPEAFLELGDALGRAGDWEEAIQAFEQAVRLEPDNLDARGNLVIALARRGRVPEAVDALERLARQCPHDAEIHLVLGTLYRRAHRQQESVRAFRWAVRLPMPPHKRRCALGEALLGEDAWTEVFESYRHAAGLAAPAGEWAPVGQSVLNHHPAQTPREFRRVAPRPPAQAPAASRWQRGRNWLRSPFQRRSAS
jgi:tetratricopeptide (TPR) repeat protein